MPEDHQEYYKDHQDQCLVVFENPDFLKTGFIEKPGNSLFSESRLWKIEPGII